jgi:hypothetical protein
MCSRVTATATPYWTPHRYTLLSTPVAWGVRALSLHHAVHCTVLYCSAAPCNLILSVLECVVLGEGLLKDGIAISCVPSVSLYCTTALHCLVQQCYGIFRTPTPPPSFVAVNGLVHGDDPEHWHENRPSALFVPSMPAVFLFYSRGV